MGELIFRLRDEVLESHRNLLQSESGRKQSGTALAKPFEVLGDLSEDQINALVEVCQQSIDSFAKLLLAYQEHQGSQLRFADNKLAHFVLVMQVLDFSSQEVIEEHCLNRTDGTKFAVPDHFGTTCGAPAGLTLRHDNGLVFGSQAYRALVRDYGLTQEYIAPCTHEQNGLRERFIKTFIEGLCRPQLFASLDMPG